MAKGERGPTDYVAAPFNTSEEAQMQEEGPSSASASAITGEVTDPLAGLSPAAAAALVGSLGLTRGGSSDMP